MEVYRGVFFFLVIFCSSLHANDSVTARIADYRTVCLEASESDEMYAKFRRNPTYVEIFDCNNSYSFVRYIRDNMARLSPHLKEFEKLDQIGGTNTKFYPKLGKFSPATLRYIFVSDHILKLFELPEHSHIVQIGAGFGGQCYILSRLTPFIEYTMFDLPEEKLLINRVLSDLGVGNAKSTNLQIFSKSSPIDLLISNYGFSECSYATQMEYFEKVIKHADRGYLLYNQHAQPIYGVDAMTAEQFFALLTKHGMNPKMHKEPIPTAKNNYLITWDRTVKKHVYLANQVSSFFTLPNIPRIAEIGGGLGSQCFMLSKMTQFTEYYIFDVPEVNVLVDKVLDELGIENAASVNILNYDSKYAIDLLLSNYAFSECGKRMQMEYFSKVIVHADRGYFIYKHSGKNGEGDNPMSANQFFALLKEKGMHPRMSKDPTVPDKYLISWDKTEL